MMNQEEALLRAFIDPNRMERYLGFIASPKKRVKLIKELAHFKALNPAFLVRLPANQRNVFAIIELLKAKGAGPKCWVISENAKLDGQEADLETALKETVGYQMGTLISCVPGRLGYFEDEDGRWILERIR
ncbi:MAG TPA: hypothetical protein VKR59_10830 [Terriglobales bacterium]|nr:hypothetical protein [Terriglobales bacterium]